MGALPPRVGRLCQGQNPTEARAAAVVAAAMAGAVECADEDLVWRDRQRFWAAWH
jgi:hypothetical protein